MVKQLNEKNYNIEPKNVLKDNQVLSIKDLNVSFKNKQGFIRAVRGIDLNLHKGEIIGLVGESGSGKSVSVKSIIGFNDNDTTEAKNINLNGINILTITKKQWPNIRGTQIAYIPQDPLMALNPTTRIGPQIIEAIKITQKRRFYKKINEIKRNLKNNSINREEAIKLIDATKKEYKNNINRNNMKNKMIEVLNFIGIIDPNLAIKSYPHEFSGGMRQRIVIAITIVGDPDIIIADEPTTALDVTIQAKVVDLIKKLRSTFNISIIFISHNIALVANLCDYIYIMYAGKVVEKGTTEDIFTKPCHPYTWALISSIPDANSQDKLISIPGTPPNMVSPPKGDAFAPRNKYARKIDFEKEPPLFKVSNTHFAATWLLHPDAPKVEMPQEVISKLRITKKIFKDLKK